MLTDNECIAYIEGKTSKKINIDWGITAGQHHPFSSTKGFLVAENNPGYQIWFTKDGVDYNLNAYPDTQESSLNYIVNFINFVNIDPEGFKDYIKKRQSSSEVVAKSC